MYHTTTLPPHEMAAVFKQEAHKLVDELPDTASWDDLIYQAALHRAIERGLAEADAGELIPVDELLKDYALTR
jgi:predicted transcriptional regulator